MQADQIRSFTVTPLAEKASLYAYALRSDGSHEVSGKHLFATHYAGIRKCGY
ncbi:unnamed protein product [Toxocara canis]|uniref:Linear amide C-N hydrolase n=1 Tax=Toxocara canis TaxID=6265 RepID=A0A183U4Q9_TOXCA|nr:unnamed protein product [Toxocara canis]